jgi:hypothetical protein
MVGVVCCSLSLGVEPVHGRVISFVENEKETKKTHQGGQEDISRPPLLSLSFCSVPLHHHCVPTLSLFGVVGPTPLVVLRDHLVVLRDHLVATSLSRGSTSSLVVDLYGRDSC